MHAPLYAALRAEWQKLEELPSIADECQALADRALEPNVFYDPRFMLAATPLFGAGAGAVLVRSATGRLTGLFPAGIEHWRGGVSSILAGWTHPFAPLGTPLVDRADPEAVITTWLSFLADAPMPPLMLLPFVPETGAFADALDAVVQRTGRRQARFGRHRRALLDPGTERGHYLDHAISAKRRKELHRLRRRLEEIAPVTLAIASAPDTVAPALRDFFVLEASGWKGIAGTAAANDPATRAFVERAVMQLAEAGRARVDRLMLNGRPIAATIVLQSGDTAWCWKIAYNEGLARFSPGVQLMHELTGSLLSRPMPARVDSCAVANHPMIDHIWRERLALSDRLIALRPSAGRFLMACGVETLRHLALGEARAIYHRLRGH